MDIKTLAIAGIIIYFFGGKIVEVIKGIGDNLVKAQGNDVGVYASSFRTPRAHYYGSLSTSEKDFYNMWVARFGFAPSSASQLRSEFRKINSFDKNLTNKISKSFDKSLNQNINRIIKNAHIKTSRPKFPRNITLGPFETSSFGSPFDSSFGSPFSNSLDEFSNPIPFIGSDTGFDNEDDTELTQAESDAKNLGIDSFLSDRFQTGDHAQNRVTFL